jgi:hypothetical protein
MDRTQPRGVATSLDNVVGALRIAWALLTPFLWSRRARWGATDAEVVRSLPGDSLVPSPRWTSTRALSIAAPPAAVWPWIAQLGQGRGGLYSYEILENLAGCHIRNADRILPEHQDVQPGLPIRLHPKAPPIPVHEVRPGQGLLLHGPATRPGIDPAVTWLFHLEAEGTGGTRLVVRYRVAYPPGIGMALGFGPWLVGVIHYAMERRMLLGIRDRAELKLIRFRAHLP